MPKACRGSLELFLLLKASACVIICNCDVLKRIIITKKYSSNGRRKDQCGGISFTKMKKELFLIFLGQLIISELTASLPLLHRRKPKQEEKALSNKVDGEITSAQSRLRRSYENHAHRKEARLPGSSHLRLASRDQSNKNANSRSAFDRWYATNHRNPKFIAISVFVGCLVFMAWAFAITCCWYHRRQTKRVKKATHIDVQPRSENIPDKVSRINNAHIDVGEH